jgi:hypothetical protein
MCYEKKLDVSKTEVHSIALVQSIYNNIRSNLFVMLRIYGEIDLNILLYGNTGISVGYFVAQVFFSKVEIDMVSTLFCSVSSFY